MLAASSGPWLRVMALTVMAAGWGLHPTDTAAQGDARQWLARMKAAAAGHNYQGVLVYSAGGVMSSSRVWHYRVDDSTYERLEAQDGRQQRIYRHNDEVRTVWPQTRTAIDERRETLPAWSTTPQPVDPRAAENYELRPEAGTRASRVAGRDATVIVLSPRDALRFAQRLWADQATGMLLRADVLAADGSVVESSAFSMIEFDVSPQPELVLQPLREEAGLRIVRPHNKRTRLEAEGWQLVRPVPGFALEGCVLRGSELGGKTAPMLQVVFSDGLTHVSVFVERFSAERHRSQAPARSGATHTLARRTDDHWITVVGDVPEPALKLFAEALARRR